MAALVHCIYTSCAAHPMSPDELDALLRHSRENNERHNITGILVHMDGCFLQVLEGDAQVIDALYAKILIDPRHTRITRIILESIPRRYFGEWTMGLTTLAPEELAPLVNAENTDRREALLSSLDEGRAKKLLRAFSEGRWRLRVAAHAGTAAA